MSDPMFIINEWTLDTINMTTVSNWKLMTHEDWGYQFLLVLKLSFVDDSLAILYTI